MRFKDLSPCGKKFAVLGAVSAAFLVAEVVVRLILLIAAAFGGAAEYPDTGFTQLHPVMGYTLKRNYKDRAFSINSQGFRRSGPIPDEGVRLACVGAGMVFGRGIYDNRLIWTERLQEILTNDAPKKHFMVINAGVQGYTLFENILDVQLRVLDYQPRWIILVADMDHLRSFVTPEVSGTYFHYRTLSMKPDLFEKILQRSALFKIFSSNKIQTPPPTAVKKLSSRIGGILRRDLVSLVGICQLNNIRLILSTVVNTSRIEALSANKENWPPEIREHFAGLSKDQLSELINLYNNLVRRVAREYGVWLVDNAVTMLNRKEWFGPDSTHLSPTGAARLAENIASNIFDLKLY